MKRKPRERVTEQTNPASAQLDTKSTREILHLLNREDQRVAAAVRKTLPEVARAVDWAAEAVRKGGRLVYLGAGTSGRLGVLDAAESIPTFATDRVVAILAGAPAALTRSVEEVEDDPRQGVRDLRKIKLDRRDVLVGIAASGRTPYVLGGMRYARRRGAKVVALTCNPAAEIRAPADVSIIPVVGPEVIAGSSRMKAGTAQKLVLNMLSTATMVRVGRVLSGYMIHVQLTNRKLWKRAQGIIVRLTGTSEAAAARALRDSQNNLPIALLMILKKLPRSQAAQLLREGTNTAEVLREAMREAESARD